MKKNKHEDFKQFKKGDLKDLKKCWEQLDDKPVFIILFIICFIITLPFNILIGIITLFHNLDEPNKQERVILNMFTIPIMMMIVPWLNFTSDITRK